MGEVVFTFQMGIAFAVILIALVCYALELASLEIASFGAIAAFLIFFHLFPVSGLDGANRLDAVHLLEGFANPALFAVVALLVIGEGLVRTGVLDQTAQAMFRAGRQGPVSVALALVAVVVVSAFLNNIPVVVIFIPIVKTLAERLGRPSSRLMMPLSFAAILGGMTTLIGSSTNLLVSGELADLGIAPFAFFDFTLPGLVLAAVGMLYVMAVAPRLLPAHAAPTESGGGGRHFIAQLTVSPRSKLVGATPVAGRFPSLPMVTVRMIQRGDDTVLPPFEDVIIEPGDIIVVAATRKNLSDAITRDPLLLRPSLRDDAAGDVAADGSRPSGSRVLAEAMVTPSSLLIGKTLDMARFHETHGCEVIGIRRRSRMIRAKLTDIHLEAGDVLLLVGWPSDISALRASADVVLMEWSASDLPTPYYARRAGLIFLVVVLIAASGVLPIAVAAIGGAGLMVATRVLTLEQANHAIDRKIIVMIGTALAFGAALQVTGGADFLAQSLLAALSGESPAVVLSAFFLLVALISNIISTKACAVLFTPIAVGIGHGMGVDPMPFAVAVVFAANCSFASPIGYQTNLLVMTPGQYRFVDFARAGAPLIFVLWIVFSIFAPWYYGLG